MEEPHYLPLPHPVLLAESAQTCRALHSEITISKKEDVFFSPSSEAVYPNTGGAILLSGKGYRAATTKTAAKA